MAKIPIVTAKKLISYLEKYGCVVVSVRGSHHKMYNPKTNKTSPVSVHAGEDLDRKAFANTLKQLGIEINDFLKTL